MKVGDGDVRPSVGSRSFLLAWPSRGLPTLPSLGPQTWKGLTRAWSWGKREIASLHCGCRPLPSSGCV